MAQHPDAENPAEAGLPAQTFRTAVSIAGGPSYDEIVIFDVRYGELLLWALDAPPQHRAVIEELIAAAMACPGVSMCNWTAR